ncbi:hypothetical protein [Streptomyces candidus]|uniref:Uncharacterized protein n=1 Tax=Streptomyces candidus TaxID=67283 RepID=A0A7X0HNM6_9ACTN|nr:hypothetical protein [Streptomyces candidus]MBB6439714.1 hypothetical protein [Streptomyces candidus]GHH45835.1 hypothetical protein GCM10018773_36070 [Streptomyces candidus]
MLDPELLERITAGRTDLDEVEEQLAKQLAEERASAAPIPGQVAGRAAMLIPHREPGVEEGSPPWDYQRIITAVRQAAEPVMACEVGEVVGVDVSVKAKLEPLRSKLVRPVDRGWLRKLPMVGSPRACNQEHRRLKWLRTGVTGAPTEAVRIV